MELSSLRTSTESPSAWLYGRVPNGYWDKRVHRSNYMDWLGQQCGFAKVDDWYQLGRKHFRQNHGIGLFGNVYAFSVLNALNDYMPWVNWLTWKFACVPNGFWASRQNRQAYMCWLGERLRFSTTADWYRIGKKDFYDNCGGGLLKVYFNDSPQRAVCDFLPHVDWKPWLFRSVPQGFWNEVANRLAFLSHLAAECRLETREDWLSLPTTELRSLGGYGLLIEKYDGSLDHAAEEYFRRAIAS